MRPTRWVQHLGPPLCVVAAIALGAMALPGQSIVGPAVAAVRSCPPPGGFYAAVHKAPRRDPIAVTVNLRARLNAGGEMTGRTLVVSTGSTQRQLDMAAESFAAQPLANVVVFGQNEPTRGSTVRAIDLEGGCEFVLYATSDAVRSAVVDANLDALFVHAVAAADRADRGVRRVDLANGTSRFVAAPVAAAEPFGVTFATGLRWSLAGDELAVQSCGIAACRTRVVNVASGVLQSTDRPHGQLVGLTGDRLFSFDLCPERPCPLESVDRSTGAVVGLGVDAFSARLTGPVAAPVLVADTPAGTKEIRP